MRAITGFSLEQHSGPYEDWPRVTRLLFDGRPTGAAIPGFVIEAQYECAPGYLLITSQDCPFEESNDFVLLDRAYRQIAHGGLAVPYASFLLNAHWPEGDGGLLLHYHEALFYRLAIVRRFFGRGFRLRLQRVKNYERDPRARESLEKHRVATDGSQ